MPIDNVQLLEKLCDDAVFLQQLVDSDVEKDDVNALTETLDTKPLLGYPVCIRGGLVEVMACNQEMELKERFVPNTDEVNGEYFGMSWRRETVQFPDESEEVVWHICHAVGNIALNYIDENGDKIQRTPLTYVTVEGSEIDITSPMGSHDYRRLALDSVSLLIDQIATDEDIDLTEKAERIAELFSFKDFSAFSKDRSKLIQQRLSYLNSIGLFENAVVASPIAIFRNGDDVSILKSAEDPIVAAIHYVCFDNLVTLEPKVLEDKTVLSYESNIPEFGPISIPHMPGVTKVYPIY